MCSIEKPLSDYHRAETQKGLKIQTRCKPCVRLVASAAWKDSSIAKKLRSYAMLRARERNIPFNLEVDDISVPETCPILGIRLYSGGQNAPSLDRIIPELGYTKGNVRVVSKRANTLKNDATVEEMELILADLKKIQLN